MSLGKLSLKLRVGHSVWSVTLTTNWIDNQLVNMRKYKPVLLAEQIEGVAKQIKGQNFPLKHIYCFDDLSGIEKLKFRIIRKITGADYEYYVLKKTHVVLLHSHFGNKGFDDLDVARELRIPHITSFYGNDVSLPQRKPDWTEKYHELFEKCDAFLVEGHHMKKCLIEMGCPQEKVIVYHLGIDLGKIPYIPRRIGSDGKVRILASGTFTEKKGLPYALEAFAFVREKHKNMEFILIGGVPDENQPVYTKTREAIYNVIEKYGLRDSVKLLGYLPYDEYIKISQGTHIFISPSMRAMNGDTEGGVPVSIIEMSAAGMPVLSTFHCDIPEVVINGETGYLVSERDIEALADKLDYLVSHPEQWGEMGIRGRQHIQKEYNLICQVEKLENIYTGLIEQK